MSNLSQFTNKQNLKLLWDVLLDELNINHTNTELIGNIRTVFESNINLFSLSSNPKLHIMELNKQFLSQVILAVNRLFFNVKQEQPIKRITISDEEVLEPYKIEDIHASRQSEFEKEVERKRIDMENYMTPQKPKELDFSDKNSDGKIKAMDSLVADKMAQRNLEIEQFQNNYYNTSINPKKWLTSKETSVKNNKTVIEPKLIEQKPIIKNNQHSRLKHISIDSNNNITLSIDESEKKIKKVSWDDIDNQRESTISIFNKLKKQPIEQKISMTEVNDKQYIEQKSTPLTEVNDKQYIEQKISMTEVNDKQYIEQKSTPLTEVKREEIQRNQVTLPTPNNEPLIPKIEIIKQLNEMNKKIDNLYEMVYKLTNLMEKYNT